MRSVTLIFSFLLLTGSIHGALISHYTFDSESGGQTSDSIGSSFATLGGGVEIDTTVADRIGSGALRMNGSDSINGPGDGAVTDNDFTWSNDARTITFWWRAENPNVQSNWGTYFSNGDLSGSGTRFDIREDGDSGANLRVEVEGAGFTTDPANFDDANWHFVAVTVPDNATFQDIAWYTGVRGGTLGADLNASSNSQAIATAPGPLVFGDSILQEATKSGYVPNGYLDDFQLYDEMLSLAQINDLYTNPGSVVPEPSSVGLLALTLAMVLGSRRRRSA
ncbi:LamG-like jellyroll fold domain-containing protein [Coraliomargarita sinensis]|nr:LamG-like jellyroll fold domain-containing protein [Coraliomargarita sinensis]